MSNQTPQKKGPPQIVKLDKALSLAERWVNNMTKPANDDELTEAELVCQPPRLGLGAKVSRQSTVGPSNNPIERKLQARLNAVKRKTARSTEEESTTECNNEDDEDDKLESRSSVFAKKRTLPVAPPLVMKKKQKQHVGL